MPGLLSFVGVLLQAKQWRLTELNNKLAFNVCHGTWPSAMAGAFTYGPGACVHRGGLAADAGGTARSSSRHGPLRNRRGRCRRDGCHAMVDGPPAAMARRDRR